MSRKEKWLCITSTLFFFTLFSFSHGKENVNSINEDIDQILLNLLFAGTHCENIQDKERKDLKALNYYFAAYSLVNINARSEMALRELLPSALKVAEKNEENLGLYFRLCYICADVISKSYQESQQWYEKILNHNKVSNYPFYKSISLSRLALIQAEQKLTSESLRLYDEALSSILKYRKESGRDCHYHFAIEELALASETIMKSTGFSWDYFKNDMLERVGQEEKKEIVKFNIFNDIKASNAGSSRSLDFFAIFLPTFQCVDPEGFSEKIKNRFLNVMGMSKREEGSKMDIHDK